MLARLGVEESAIAELMRLFARGRHCLFTADTPDLATVASGPDDDIFIERAMASHAARIVTGDKALLAVWRYFDVVILNPRQFLDSSEISNLRP